MQNMQSIIMAFFILPGLDGIKKPVDLVKIHNNGRKAKCTDAAVSDRD
jgi:hypothetical protein